MEPEVWRSLTEELRAINALLRWQTVLLVAIAVSNGLPFVQ